MVTLLSSARVIALEYAALFTLLPLVFWPWASIAYELPKVWFVYGAVALVVLSTLAQFGYTKFRQINRTVLVLIVGFVLLAGISAVVGVDPVRSIWGNYYRGDGLITLFFLVGFALVTALVVRRVWMRIIGSAIALGSVAVSLWAVADGMRLHLLGDTFISNWDGAIGVAFGNPNFLAGYLLVTLPFVAQRIDTQKRLWKKLVVAALLVQSAAIVLTFSRAGIIGIGIFALLWILRCRPRYARALLIAAGLMLAVGMWYVVSDFHAEQSTFVAESRQRIIVKGLRGFAQRPLTGWGWANFDAAFASVDWPIYFEHDVYVDRAHGNLLEIFTTTGIFGGAAYTMLLVVVGMRLHHRRDSAPFIAFILFVLHSQTNVTSVAEEAVFWLLVGIALQQNSKLAMRPHR